MRDSVCVFVRDSVYVYVSVECMPCVCVCVCVCVGVCACACACVRAYVEFQSLKLLLNLRWAGAKGDGSKDQSSL